MGYCMYALSRYRSDNLSGPQKFFQIQSSALPCRVLPSQAFSLSRAYACALRHEKAQGQSPLHGVLAVWIDLFICSVSHPPMGELADASWAAIKWLWHQDCQWQSQAVADSGAPPGMMPIL